MTLGLGHRIWLLLGVAFGPLLLALKGTGGPGGIEGALLLSGLFALWALVCGDLWPGGRGRLLRARVLGYAVLGAASVGVFYGATGQVIRARAMPRNDALLQSWDRALTGAWFPEGQVSLWLDAHPWIGPGTSLGKMLTELFQVSYFSYYLWGYILLGLLGVREFKAGKGKASLDPALGRSQRDLLDFLCAWVGAYWVNFLCYIALPVIGPKFDYPQRFVHSVDGFGFARVIQDFIASQQAVMEDCFPSGHTALSWITAIAAWRFAPRYARVVTPVAAIITAATLYLRYHYVADVLAASTLIAMASVWGQLYRMPRRLSFVGQSSPGSSGSSS